MFEFSSLAVWRLNNNNSNNIEIIFNFHSLKKPKLNVHTLKNKKRKSIVIKTYEVFAVGTINIHEAFCCSESQQ